MDFKEHLGDGFYVDFDGEDLLIAVNDHRNVVAVADPYVRRKLVDYLKRINDERKY